MDAISNEELTRRQLILLGLPERFLESMIECRTLFATHVDELSIELKFLLTPDMLDVIMPLPAEPKEEKPKRRLIITNDITPPGDQPAPHHDDVPF